MEAAARAKERDGEIVFGYYNEKKNMPVIADDLAKWKRKEHIQFVRGLKDYGREWFLIQKNLVKTRSISSIKLYAQTFFVNL